MTRYFLYIALFVITLSLGQEVIITEFHYQDAGGDTGEGVEIAGQALVGSPTDLTSWSIVIYSAPATVASTTNLSGTLANGSYLWTSIVPMPDTQGSIVLWDGTNIIDSWSYGGSFTATTGVANGTTFTDVGIVEASNQSNGLSIQLTDSGWVAAVSATPGTANIGLTLAVARINEIPGFNMYPNPVVHGNLVISSPNNANKQVEIYAITGSRVFAKSVRSRENINVSNLSTGLYILKVYEEGNISTRKLMINN